MTSAIGFYQMREEQGFTQLVDEYLAYTKQQEDLDAAAKALRAKFWAMQAPLGAVNVGDFSFYDNAWDLLNLLGAKGEAQMACSGVKSYYQAVTQQNAHFAKHRWLDSEFFVIKPEFNEAAEYELNTRELFAHYHEARALGHKVKFSIMGLFSTLFFAGLDEDAEKKEFKKFKNSYFNFINELVRLEKGVEVDFNELAFSAAQDDKMTQTIGCTLGIPAVECVYDRFERRGIRVWVSSFEYDVYLLDILMRTAASGVGFDANKTPPDELLERLGKSGKSLKLGIIDLVRLDGAAMDEKIALLRHYLNFIPKEKLILSLSNRMMQTNFAYIKAHSDFTAYDEFAQAKINELVELDRAFQSL